MLALDKTHLNKFGYGVDSRAAFIRNFAAIKYGISGAILYIHVTVPRVMGCYENYCSLFCKVKFVYLF